MTTNLGATRAAVPRRAPCPPTPAPCRSRRAALWALIAVLGLPALLAPGCAGLTRTRRGDRVDVSSYPPEIQEAYRVFAFRCSRCHTLARPLNANIQDPEHWTRYVARMRRTPGSGINTENGAVILRFLLYYMEHEKNLDDEPAATPSPSRPREQPAPTPSDDSNPLDAPEDAAATEAPEAPLPAPEANPPPPAAPPTAGGAAPPSTEEVSP